MNQTLAYPYAKTCYECRADFETWDSHDEVCPRCQREWLRENCPEALAEQIPDAKGCDNCDDGWIETYPPHSIDAYLPTGEARVELVACPYCTPQPAPAEGGE